MKHKMIRIPRTYTIILTLFIQVDIFFFCAPCARSATSNQAEKLILGFEEAELGRGAYVSREEKPGRESWFYLLEQPKGFDFAARFEWPGETNRAWTWYCRQGNHTEGEMALATTVAPINTEKQKATYTRTEFLSYFYPNIRRGLVEARPLMTSFQWLVKARPDLRDFSGYDLLRVDVHSDTAPVKLWLALEDNILEPPVMRTYKIPSKQWLTVELDLREAKQVRELDLARITNFWLMAESPARTTVRIDNIRVVKHGVTAANKLIRDNSSMAVSVVRPKRPEAPSIPSTVKLDRAAMRLTKPIVVARGSIVPFGWVSAYDNRFIFVAYSARDKTHPEAKDEARAVFSDDGGRSWKQLTDPTARNLDHGTARGCTVDVTGDGIAVSSGPGCAGLGNPNPRQHLTKYTFTGNGWEARFPDILDSDIRHCGSNVSVVRLRNGPFKGRLWASWGQIGREHSIDVHVKFSDDDGRTWFPWGRGAALPGSQSADWSDGTYGYPETVICPYKEYVACFWRHKRNCGIKWSVFDGSDWSSPDQISPATLDDMDGAYRATMSAVTKGHHEIFFTATGLDTVLRWDGKSWHNESVHIEDGGILSLAGDVVMLFTSGKVNRRWKGVRWQRRAILHCYERLPNGRWENPVNLTPEFTMDEYRSLAGFSVPPYAPENFIPLVWSDYDEGTVKLLKVPVPLKINKKDK
jgi:hypothetical protein